MPRSGSIQGIESLVEIATKVMIRIAKLLSILGCVVLAGCALLDKISGHRPPRHSARHHPAPSHPTPRPRPTAAKPTPEPTAPGLHAPRPPETISNQQFHQSASELEERTRNEKEFVSFADGLKKIANNPSLSADTRQTIFSAIITKAKLTGKVRPEADAINNYYQSPETSAEDRQVLDASLTSELSKMPKSP